MGISSANCTNRSISSAVLVASFAMVFAITFSSSLSLSLPLKCLPNIPLRLSNALLRAPFKPLPLARFTAVFKAVNWISIVLFPKGMNVFVLTPCLQRVIGSTCYAATTFSVPHIIEMSLRCLQKGENVMVEFKR